MLVALLATPAMAARGTVALGGGVIHTGGGAIQIAAEIHGPVELHYSAWRDHRRDHALGIGYRFRRDRPLSMVLGVAYIGTLTRNLLRQEDAYIEVRFRFSDRFFCQISHYSSVGDDKGENFALCGTHWAWPSGQAPTDAEQ